MIDMALFSSAVTSLNSMKTLVSSAVGTRDEFKRLSAINEISAQLGEANGKVLALQIAASKSNTEHETVLRKKRNLEEQVMQLESQKADFSRYELHELAVGVFVHALRPPDAGAEPIHLLCTRCRNEGKKSILIRLESAVRISHVCPVCSTEYVEKNMPRTTAVNAHNPYAKNWMNL